MQRFILLTVISILLQLTSQPATAQQTSTLNGFILNTETGEPIVHASIVIPGTKTGTNSGTGGYFELPLHSGKHTLRITSVGFSAKEIEVQVNDQQNETLKIGLQPKKLEIEGVDVFGRLNDHRDTSLNRVPGSIVTSLSRVNKAEIEKIGAVTLVDALKFVPGGWTENRGRKTKQFFSVRGQKYPYPDYSIDGVWQKEFEETGYFLSALDIESVEIVRSGTALVKGLSGLTGVVDVKTKKPDRETFNMLAKYGQLNSYMTNVGYGNKIKEVSFNTSASLFGTDGPEGRNGRERMSNFHGSMDWKITPKINLMAGTTYIYGLRQLVNIVEPGAASIANREEEYDPVRTLLSYVKMDYKASDGSVTEMQANVSYRNSGFSSYNIPQKTTTEYDEKDWEYGFNLLHSRSLGKENTLRAGALYNHWVAPEGKRFYVGRACNVHTWSAVVADEQRVGKFLFDGGFRAISGYIVEWGGFGIEGSSAGFEKVPPIEDQAAPFEWQSVLGASYSLSDYMSMHCNFSGGTIAPRQGSLTSNGERPETEGRLQNDLGVRLRSARGNELTFTGFYTKRNNAIDYSGLTVTDGDGQVMELYENVDKRSYGVEMTAKWNIPVLRSYWFANVLLMKGEKEKNGKMADDVQLPNVILNTGFYFEISRFDANVFVNYTGPYSNNRFVAPAWVKVNGDFPLGDFVSADCTAGYTIPGKFTKRIFIEIKNILDKNYLTVAGYPDQGRLLQAGCRIGF